MNKYWIILALGIVVTACNAPVGELSGSANSSKMGFSDTKPIGMQLIRKGTFMMGAHKPSGMFPGREQAKQVTVESFFIDETEITNYQYRQFVNWVRDSIAYRELIAIGRNEYAVPDPNNESDSVKIRWSMKIRWNDRNEEVQEALSKLFYQGENQLSNRQLNPARLNYRYEIFNYDQTSLPQNQFNYKTNSYGPNAFVTVDTSYLDENGLLVHKTIRRKLTKRTDFFSVKMVNIYPDTMTWTRNMQFSYNDPKMKMYFSDPNYADYPVVGITWEQAMAFCHWRTKIYNDTHRIKTEPYRLPTEAEWEFAAKGRDKNAIYPWGGEKLIDEKNNCFNANFKQSRGNYVSDAGVTTKPVKSYNKVPNANGLYDMAGNVAEWTSTAWISTSGSVIADINPKFEYNAKVDDPIHLKKKVVKGGSWKDIPYFLQSGSRSTEYQYESRPFIGFRCVRSYKGDLK